MKTNTTDVSKSRASVHTPGPHVNSLAQRPSKRYAHENDQAFKSIDYSNDMTKFNRLDLNDSRLN